MVKRVLVVFLSLFLGVAVLFVVGYAQNYGKLPLTEAERRLVGLGVMRAPIPLKTFRLDEKELQQMERARAVIRTSLGDITIKFYPREAPQTCWNFIRLANRGFYRDSSFYLVDPLGAIRGGMPADGSTDAGYHIEDEVNEHRNLPGTVGMFKPAALPDSASCIFYVCFNEVPAFDKVLTVFGQVVEGMDVVEKMAAVEVDDTGRPKEQVVIKEITLREVGG